MSSNENGSAAAEKNGIPAELLDTASPGTTTPESDRCRPCGVEGGPARDLLQQTAFEQFDRSAGRQAGGSQMPPPSSGRSGGVDLHVNEDRPFTVYVQAMPGNPVTSLTSTACRQPRRPSRDQGRLQHSSFQPAATTSGHLAQRVILIDGQELAVPDRARSAFRLPHRRIQALDEDFFGENDRCCNNIRTADHDQPPRSESSPRRLRRTGCWLPPIPSTSSSSLG